MFVQPVVDAFDPRLLIAQPITHDIDFLTSKVPIPTFNCVKSGRSQSSESGIFIYLNCVVDVNSIRLRSRYVPLSLAQSK